MAYKNKTGWYNVINKEKIIIPLDEHMGSFKNGYFKYKSSLELIALKYFDTNPNIVKFSLEPFHIKYIKPTDGKIHRYYIDFYIEFSSGEKFLVEVKPFSQIIPPKKSKKNTEKSLRNFKKAQMTWKINSAKWAAAGEYCSKNNMRFIFLTEKELKK